MTRSLLLNPTLLTMFFCLAAMAVEGGLDAARSCAADGETILFRKVLDDGRQLVVVRGPRHSMADIAPPIMPKSNFKRIPDKGYFSVSLQVQPKQGPALLLASTLMPVLSEDASLGFDVFDIFVDDGLIAVAVGTHDIEIWRVTPSSAARMSVFAPEEPKPPLPVISAAALPPYWNLHQDGNVCPNRKSFNVKLSLTANRRVQVDADDLEATGKRHTRFVQIGDDWKFDVAPHHP